MGLQPTTIRFPRDALVLLQRAAEQTGCTAAQFVREAALMRAVLTLDSKRDAPQLADEIARLASVLDLPQAPDSTRPRSTAPSAQIDYQQVSS